MVKNLFTFEFVWFVTVQKESGIITGIVKLGNKELFGHPKIVP